MMMMMMMTITITIWKIQPFSLMIFSAWNLHPEGIFQPRLMTPEGLSRNREYIPFFQHGMMIWLGTGRLRLAMENKTPQCWLVGSFRWFSMFSTWKEPTVIRLQNRPQWLTINRLYLPGILYPQMVLVYGGESGMVKSDSSDSNGKSMIFLRFICYM